MEGKEIHIPLKCLFCGCGLKLETQKEFESGDLLKCQECGELNDLDSVMEVAMEEGKESAVNYAKDEISKTLKDVFK